MIDPVLPPVIASRRPIRVATIALLWLMMLLAVVAVRPANRVGALGQALQPASGQDKLLTPLAAWTTSPDAAGTVSGYPVAAENASGQAAAEGAAIASSKGTVIVVDSAGNANVIINGSEMSIHAAQQAATRGITIGDIENAINKGETFTYTQNGETIVGDYDATTSTFVGVGNRITTVLNPRNPTTYIANLKARQ